MSASSPEPRRPEAAPEPNLVRAHLDRILASESFSRSERHRKFLQFVVEETLAGREGQLKETVIAAEVFGRGESFDPRLDSIVRLQALRLRERLEQYYATKEGAASTIVLELPKGAYVPVFHTRTVAEPAEVRGAMPSARVFALAAIVAVAICLAAAWWVVRARSGAPRSIAVLPFLDLSAGGGNQHIADGLVEDLTTGLSRQPGLRTSARTSAFQFRGKDQDARKIGRELDVEAVIEGSIRRQDQRIVVTVQMIETGHGYHIWSNTYDCDAADLWSTERQIERDAATALALRYSAPKPSHVPPTAAREEYWRGHFLLTDYRRSGDSIPFLERAVALDGRYAEAWSSLAAARAFSAFFFERPPESETPKAVAAAQKAIEMDESKAAEAYLALAVLGQSHRRDWTVAERAFRRALELDPGSSLTHLRYAAALADHDRTEEALQQDALARQADPASYRAVATNEATLLYFARRYDDALRIAARHLEMDPKLTSARYAEASCYSAMGRYREAIRDFRQLLDEDVVSFPVLGRLAHALIRNGGEREARPVIAKIDAMEAAEPAGTSLIARAQIELALGHRSAAMSYLEKSAERATPDVNHLGVDPIWDPMRDDPAFQALCARLELPVKKR